MALIDVTAANSAPVLEAKEIVEKHAGRTVSAAHTIFWQILRGLGNAVMFVHDGIDRLLSRSSQRRQLSELESYRLSDLGLSRADVEQELSKFFWQK